MRLVKWLLNVGQFASAWNLINHTYNLKCAMIVYLNNHCE